LVDIKGLAEKMGVRSSMVIKALWKKGYRVIIEDCPIEKNEAIEAAEHFGYSIKFFEEDEEE